VSFNIIFGTLSFPISDQAGSSVTITSAIVDASSLILFHKCFHCRSFPPVNCNMTLDSCYPLYFSIKAHIFSRPHQISSLWRTTIHTHREGHIDTHTTAHSNWQSAVCRPPPWSLLTGHSFTMCDTIWTGEETCRSSCWSMYVAGRCAKRNYGEQRRWHTSVCRFIQQWCGLWSVL